MILKLNKILLKNILLLVFLINITIFLNTTTTVLISAFMVAFGIYLYLRKIGIKFSTQEQKHFLCSSITYLLGQILALIYREYLLEYSNFLYFFYFLIVLSQIISIYLFVKFYFNK